MEGEGERYCNVVEIFFYFHKSSCILFPLLTDHALIGDHTLIGDHALLTDHPAPLVSVFIVDHAPIRDQDPLLELECTYTYMYVIRLCA